MPGENKIIDLEIGQHKSEAEKILGDPIREWSTSSNVNYCVYSYKTGVSPSIGDASAHVFMDVASFGIWELVWATMEDDYYETWTRYEKIAIAYDNDDTIVRIIDEFRDFDIVTEIQKDDDRTSQTLPFIKDGISTKHEIIERFGAPAESFMGGQIVIYLVGDKGKNDLEVLNKIGAPSRQAVFDHIYHLILTFNSDHILKKHSLLDTREWSN